MEELRMEYVIPIKPVEMIDCSTLLKEVLYEYLGKGLFNDVDTLCEELKKRLS